MAESMLSKSPHIEGGQKDAPASLFRPGSIAQELEKTRKDKEKTQSSHVPADKSSMSTSNSGTKTTSKSKPLSQKDISAESLKILQQLNENVKKQGSDLKALSESQKILTTRVDNLYDSYDNDAAVEYGECDEQEDYDYMRPVSVDCDTPLSSVCEYSEIDGDENIPPQPPTKKQKTGSGIFKGLTEKYHVSEKVSDGVDGDLAEFVNSSFRHGVSDEMLNEVIKDTNRPDNCSALTKTRVNPGIWRLLKTPTQMTDNKMQSIQNLVVKAGILIVNYMDKFSSSDDTGDMIQFGSNTLALLGQANHLINNKRKESHRSDLDAKYAPLTSATLPYTEWLYGDEQDINKNIRDIQDMSKIGRIGRGSFMRARGRGRGPRGYGGYRRPWARGVDRRYRGRGRGFFRQSQDDDDMPSSKNSKMGQRK